MFFKLIYHGLYYVQNLVQEDEKGILYRTMFDDYILDNSKFQMVM